MIKNFNELLNNVKKWENYLQNANESEIPTLYLLYKTLDIPIHIVNQLYVLKRNHYSITNTNITINKNWRELAPQITKIIDKLRIELAYYYEYRVLNLYRVSSDGDTKYHNTFNANLVTNYYNTHMKKYIEQWRQEEDTITDNKTNIEIKLEINNDTPRIK